MAFRGTFDYSLDVKNRLTVPAKFRAALSDGVVLAKDLNKCVGIWRPEDYAAYTSEAVTSFPRLSPQARKLRSFFAANSLDTELDSAGRVGLPPFLIEHAGLSKEVVVVGAEDSLQVWDRATWADYNDALTSEVEDITALLGQAPS